MRMGMWNKAITGSNGYLMQAFKLHAINKTVTRLFWDWYCRYGEFYQDSLRQNKGRWRTGSYVGLL